jgi:hypothetical protein
VLRLLLPIVYGLRATLPAGGVVDVELRVADVVSTLALKGIALGERYVEKDAYDIMLCVPTMRMGHAPSHRLYCLTWAKDPLPAACERLTSNSVMWTRPARIGWQPSWVAVGMIVSNRMLT